MFFINTVIIVIILCVCCVYHYYKRNICDTFATTTPTSVATGPYYNVNTPVYVRRNSLFCYYKAIITILPTKDKPYYTVSYQEDEQNPNGSKTYVEIILKNDAFTANDNANVRLLKRILRREITDIDNIAFVNTQMALTPNAIFNNSLTKNKVNGK